MSSNSRNPTPYCLSPQKFAYHATILRIAGDRRLRTQYTPVLGGPQKSLEMQMGREHTTAPAALTDDPADVVPVMDADYTDRVSELTPLPCISREIRGNWSKLLMR